MDKRALYQARLPELEKRVRRLAARAIADPGLADDVVQETLRRSFRYLNSLQDPRKLAAWVQAIARNQIHRALADRRNLRWEQLAEEAEAAPPEARRSLCDELDAIVNRLAALRLTTENLRAIALHFACDWKAAEIAAITGGNLNTVYRQLAGAKRALGKLASEAQADENVVVSLKAWLANDLYLAAACPIAGAGERNDELAYQAHGMAVLAELRHPRNSQAVGLRMAMEFHLARWSERPGIEQHVSGAAYGHWQRHLWEPRCREAAEAAYSRYLKLSPPPFEGEFNAAIHAVFSPLRNEDVDWEKAHRHAEKSYELRGGRATPYLVALTKSRFKSPFVAAVFLENFAGSPLLREDPMCALLLGRLYFSARRWGKARQYYRKFLTWLRHPVWARHIRERIADCRRHLGVRGSDE